MGSGSATEGAVPGREWTPLLAHGLPGWRMAGEGGFEWLPDGGVESRGGPGLLWYASEAFGDFQLRVVWRLCHLHDNSGVFVRCPALDHDIRPALEQGYEVQIDDRGVDPSTGRLGDPKRLTGAIYERAPASARASRQVGAWNEFEILVQGRSIAVELNDMSISDCDMRGGLASGHIALQCHHPGSAVQFRTVDVLRL